MRKVLSLTLLTLSLTANASAAMSAKRKGPQGKGPEKLYSAAFEMDWERYPPPDAILRSLQALHPLLDKNRSSLADACQILTEDNRTTLGDSNAVTGAPSLAKPNSSFVVWYSKCLTAYSEGEKYSLEYLNNPSDQKVLRFYGSLIVDACKTGLQGCLWDQVPAEVQKRRLRDLVVELIGPRDVLRDLGIASSEEELADKIWIELKNAQDSGDQRYGFLNVSRSFSAGDALRIAKFLILMTDMLRY